MLPNTNYPYYYQNQMSYQGMKGRPVASLEEARASIVDFDGSVFYFPDVANQRIYTKQINRDGTSSLLTYQLVETPSQPSFSTYITKEEFESKINELVVQINQLKQTPTVRSDFEFK